MFFLRLPCQFNRMSYSRAKTVSNSRLHPLDELHIRGRRLGAEQFTQKPFTYAKADTSKSFPFHLAFASKVYCCQSKCVKNFGLSLYNIFNDRFDFLIENPLSRGMTLSEAIKRIGWLWSSAFPVWVAHIEGFQTWPASFWSCSTKLESLPIRESSYFFRRLTSLRQYWIPSARISHACFWLQPYLWPKNRNGKKGSRTNMTASCPWSSFFGTCSTISATYDL